MNIKDYIDKKAKGLAEIVAAGGGYAFATKQYSQDDGSELTPEIVAVDIEEIKAQKAELLSDIEDYDLVIADVEVLEADKIGI